MLVTSQCEGNRVTGLYIGADNVRRYFPRRVSRIELQLDHLRIECGLAPVFWNGQPEIHDARLCLWLELKQSHTREPKAPMALAMTPSGDHCFTLGPVSRVRQAATKPASNQRDDVFSPALEDQFVFAG